MTQSPTQSRRHASAQVFQAPNQNDSENNIQTPKIFSDQFSGYPGHHSWDCLRTACCCTDTEFIHQFPSLLCAFLGLSHLLCIFLPHRPLCTLLPLLPSPIHPFPPFLAPLPSCHQAASRPVRQSSTVVHRASSPMATSVHERLRLDHPPQAAPFAPLFHGSPLRPSCCRQGCQLRLHCVQSTSQVHRCPGVLPGCVHGRSDALLLPFHLHCRIIYRQHRVQ